MTVETLAEWARRQGASGVVASGPRNQLNRAALQTAASRKSRDQALKELYIELEALIDLGATPARPALPTEHDRGIRKVSPPPATPSALAPPTLGGRLFFSAGTRAPSVLPEGMVERRRPRPT